MLKHRMNAIRQLLLEDGPTRTALREIEVEMRLMATERDFSQYRRASPGEELAHKLDVPSDGGASLYLVSDGHGTVTPPHRHDTWAVIVGLEGREMNQIYKVSSSTAKTVEQIKVKTIGPGESIVMSEEDIHGTVTVGPDATFHLHLYGVDLSTLPPISERTYMVVPARHQS